MKNFKWINLSLFLLLGILVVYQVGIASAQNGRAKPSQEIPIKPSEISTTELETLYQKALALTDKFTKEFQAKPGKWHHWSAIISNDPREPMVYSDGSSIPPKTLHESWYTLNSANMIEDGFYLVKDMDGKILQQVLYQDNVAYNLTFPDIKPLQMTPDQFEPVTSFDFNFTNDLRRQIDNGKVTRAGLQVIDKSDFAAEHQSIWQFTVDQEYQEPLSIASMAAPVRSVSTRINYDPKTGASTQIERIFQLTDGEEYITSISVTSFAEERLYMVIPSVLFSSIIHGKHMSARANRGLN